MYGNRRLRYEKKEVLSLDRLRARLKDPMLKESYRKNPKAFTRNRKLNFLTTLVLILQKSRKSAQVKLNEFFAYMEAKTASASAFTQAKAKLSHSVFIELNKDAYLNFFYSKDDYQTYKGYRLLAIDGSKLRLPDNKEIREEFGSVRIKNQYGAGSYTGGLSSVMYDVLNENVLDSVLAPANSNEITLAHEHIKLCGENDLILFDRNYPGYELFADLFEKNIDFVARCSSNAFGVIGEFIAQKEVDDSVITLKPYRNHRSKVKRGLLPGELQIRLVKILLSTGEVEILATSLLNCLQHPLKDFQELYAMRWGVETLFDRLKNRLSLGNFTGETSEAVKQDFYATILIANVESEVTVSVDDELKQESKNKHKQKVNKTVSYNAIKAQALNLLFCNEIDLPILVEQLRALFRRNTIPIRPLRSYSRETTFRRALHYHQFRKKIAF